MARSRRTSALAHRPPSSPADSAASHNAAGDLLRHDGRLAALAPAALAADPILFFACEVILSRIAPERGARRGISLRFLSAPDLTAPVFRVGAFTPGKKTGAKRLAARGVVSASVQIVSQASVAARMAHPPKKFRARNSTFAGRSASRRMNQGNQTGPYDTSTLQRYPSRANRNCSLR